jgi:hypothetical protein
MSNMPAALPPFAVAAAGVGLAWLAFETTWLLSLVAVLAVAGFSFALFLAGKNKVKTDPVGAIRLMKWRLLAPGAAAAAATAVLIGVAVWLTAPKHASTEATKLLAASVAAFTGFLSTLIVKDAEKADETWLAKPIRSAFQEKFKGVFAAESRGALAVFAGSFEGSDGWTRDARKARAKAIKQELEKPQTDAGVAAANS